MSTYVFSDVHGHRAALERALDRVSPSNDDTFYCLGDMIDRGPDPVGVMRTVRSLPHVQVVMGNHEDLMIQAIDHPDDGVAVVNWGINGGGITYDALRSLAPDEFDELLLWTRGLPRWAFTRVGGQLYLMAHAGVNLDAAAPATWDDDAAQAYLSSQDPEDLTWIREAFWGAPDGLKGDDGLGPVVIAGHTPTVYLDRMVIPGACDRPALNDQHRAQMVRVGPHRDRWDIDAAAAGGSSFGQVLVLRLDDGQEFYEPVLDDE